MTDTPAEIDIRADAAVWRRDAAETGAHIERAARAALAGFRGTAGVSVLLTDDAAMAELNARWRGRDGPTNVLSFPADEPPAPEGAPAFLGDIVLAHETLAREAERDGVSFADHLAHLVVHGVLHLRGYDHGTDTEAEEMEALETDILAGLGIDDPYREDMDTLARQSQ